MKCRCCESKIVQFFSLGEMPLVNSFLRKRNIHREKKFDLSIGFCPKCFLVQLIKTIDPKDLFEDYIYFSSTSKTFLDHCKKTADNLSRRLKLDREKLVLEIASNDGSQLSRFKKLGIRILGVDPAKNIAKLANRRGIKTIPEFFNYRLARKLTDSGIKADLVLGENVLAHVPNIRNFMDGVSLVLSDKGTAVFEFPYLDGLLKNKFDTIYHEHVFYFSLLSLINLFKKAGLEIYDVEKTDMQGGSLRIFASHAGCFSISKNILKLKKKEMKQGFDNIRRYTEIERNITKLKVQLLLLLEKIKKEGKSVAVYSAPAKGNILLNFFGIKKFLDFIVDKAKEKQGLYTPGTHFRVYPPEKIFREKPDYLLILCWNIAEEVISQLSDYKKLGGKFIIPVPSLKIV